MTFEEWWATEKPSLPKELKESFEECWVIAFSEGHIDGYNDGYDQCNLDNR